jgi:hypothetical protein
MISDKRSIHFENKESKHHKIIVDSFNKNNRFLY